MKAPTSWSRDGTVLVYQTGGNAGADLWALREGRPEQILATRFDERMAALSPDGRWLAYQSNRSGAFEIYVRPYPGPGPEAPVSTQGGWEPVWAPDGAELFYRTEDQLMAAAVDLTSGFRADAPRALFEEAYFRQQLLGPSYDVAPDGEHFVFVRTTGGDEGGAGARLIVVESFLGELKRLAPN